VSVFSVHWHSLEVSLEVTAQGCYKDGRQLDWLWSGSCQDTLNLRTRV